MTFIAPQPSHPFFQSPSIQGIMRNINKELSWSLLRKMLSSASPYEGNTE
jgi:hypothetical protein